jgi:molybdopterin converting factor small subunit
LARVVVPPSLRARFGDVSELVIEAPNVRALIAALEARVPGFAAEIEAQLAIAIDGEIYADAFLEPLDAESEVHFLPRLRGG